MTITRQEKEQIVKELTEVFKTAKGVVFANYRGLTVKDFESLRRKMRELGGKIKVAKLTLTRKALKDAGFEVDFAADVPTAIAYSPDDEVLPAKILAGFGDKDKKLELLAGIMEGRLMTSAEVTSLSKLPSKQELRGQLVSVIAGSMRGFVGVLAGVERSLLYVLQAVAKSKGAS